jgi:predicted nucleic acid-binding protein
VIAGDTVAAPVNVIAEIVFAWRRGNLDDPRYARLPGLLTQHLNAGTFEVLQMDRHAAELSGQIRARCPLPPRGRRRGRSKADQRVNWVTDIHIAATTWASGYDIQTANTRDFETISELIAQVVPSEARLSVLPPPASF